MKTLFLIAASICSAQSFSPSISTPFSYPGSTFILSVTFQDASPSLNAAGFQWTLNLPPGFTAGSAIAGPASLAAQKTVSCNGLTCLTTGVNANTYTSGVVATIPVTIGAAGLGPQSLSITSVVANISGGQAPVPSDTMATIQVNPNTGTTLWFTATAAPVTCRVSKVAQTPIRVSFVCFDTFGAYSGSYTADATNGGNGTNYFYVGLNSISNPPVVNANLSCSVQMNGTSSPQMMLNGVSVLPFSSAYSCSGYSTNGQGVVSWP